MRNGYSIGIDVGGTNTDIVLLNDGKLINTLKTPTTNHVTDGVIPGIKQIICDSHIQPQDVTHVQLGTTHMLNALLQGNVESIAIVRLGAPSTTSLPPLSNWENEILKKKIAGLVEIIHGGFHYNGNLISPLVKQELINIAKKTKELEIKKMAITGVYSQLNANQELLARKIIQQYNPSIQIFLSHHHEGSLMERENATIINATLNQTLMNVTAVLKQQMKGIGLSNAQLLISENDGTVSPIEFANSVTTLRAATRNSMRGAIKLCRFDGLVVVIDIGGTSADGAVVRNGQVIEQNVLVKEAGISLTVPTVRGHSICLGGGTRIERVKDQLSLGTSVANQLLEDSICFGGKVLTITDVAIAKGRINSKNAHAHRMLTKYNRHDIEEFDDFIHSKLVDFVFDVGSSIADPVKQLVLVGGGSALFDKKKLMTLLAANKSKITHIQVPENAAVANAYGAATAHLAVSHTEIVDLDTISRVKAEQQAIIKAKVKLLAKGALEQSIKVKTVIMTDIQYVPGSPTKIRVKCIGSRNEAMTNIASFRPQEKSVAERLTETKTYKLMVPMQSDLKLRSTETPEMPNSSAKKAMQKLYSVAPQLSKKDIRNRAIGFDYLGSGGGGATRLSEGMVNAAIGSGKIIKEIDLAVLPDDSKVFCFGLMGSPAVFEENPPSLASIKASVQELEAKLGYKFDAIIPYEGGGTNGLLPYVAAAELSIPVVKADVMGRAFPGINMVTPIIEDAIEYHVAAIASANMTKLIEEKDAISLENTTRTAIGEQGGAVLSYLPMDGKTAKKVCIKNTPEVAENIGRKFQEARRTGASPMIKINEYLRTSDYGEIHEVANGRVIDIIRKDLPGFNIGGVVVVEGNRRFEVIFQNENIIVREKFSNGKSKLLAEVPDLISIVDQDSYEPLGTPDYDKVCGQKIRILTMQAPPLLRTKQALKVVGSKSSTYRTEKILEILDYQPPVLFAI